jgi:LacI family transcriptional regulator
MILRKRYLIGEQTIHDIARAAGVSPATVSKAFNGTDRISAATRERILAIAKHFNWQPNSLARGLVLRRSHLIGMIVSSITNDFCAQLYDGAESYAARRGYSLLLCVTDNEAAHEVLALRRLTASVHADGIIAIPVTTATGTSPFYDLVAAEYPFVLVSQRITGMPADYVVCNDIEGGRLATAHLIERGHSRIAYVYDVAQAGCTNVVGRREGYQAALKAGGIECDPALSAGVNLRSGPEEQAPLREMMDARKPTAIFAHNDRTAVTVLQWLKWARLAVPSDVALVGFANLNLASIVTPTLTTVDFGVRETGRLAAKALIDKLEGKVTEKQQIVMKPKIVVRESSGGRA